MAAVPGSIASGGPPPTESRGGALVPRHDLCLCRRMAFHPGSMRRIGGVARSALALSAAAAVGVGWWLLSDVLTMDMLRTHRHGLAAWVDGNVALAALCYVALYAAAAAMAIPCGVILSVMGGFVFGAGLGAPLAVASATLGAALLFIGARAVLGPRAAERLGGPAARIAEGLRRDALPYMLAMRLSPFIPFFLVNLVPAVAGVPLRSFLIATFLGVIPAVTIYSLAGAGLGALLDAGQAVTARSLITPEVAAGLCGLAVLALGSIPVRRWALGRIPRGR
jgi:uncharacterized membrane protein YdjX (TVP38/TMEM64 family)